MNHTNAIDPPHIEAWTAYFPTTLSRENHLCPERIQGPYFWIPDSGRQSRRSTRGYEGPSISVSWLDGGRR
ncbi:hypothetical protein BDV12DRAFT_179494 [Aspergillus spectabilis]